MPNINSEGSFNVTLKKATFTDRDKPENPGAYSINVLGITPDELEMWGSINFSHTIISSGQNEGKTVAEASRLLLLDLGVKDGYEGNLASAIEQGLEANFTVKWDNYRPEKPVLKVAFVNPVRSITPVADVDWASVMAKFDGKDVPAHTPTVPAPAVDEKGIPQPDPVVETPAVTPEVVAPAESPAPAPGAPKEDLPF